MSLEQLACKTRAHIGFNQLRIKVSVTEKLFGMPFNGW
jgi:hypothetical protein